MKKTILLLLSSVLVFGAEAKKPEITKSGQVAVKTAENVTIKPEDILKVRNLQVKYLTLLQDENVKKFIQTSAILNAAVENVKKQYHCTVLSPTDDGFDCISTGKTTEVSPKEVLKNKK